MGRNQQGTLLALLARTATATSADQTTYDARGVRVFIEVTVDGAAASVVPTIEVKDPVSGVYTAILTGAAIAAVGHTILTVCPGITVVAGVSLSVPIGKVWRLKMTHADADAITYSAGYSTLS